MSQSAGQIRDDLEGGSLELHVVPFTPREVHLLLGLVVMETNYMIARKGCSGPGLQSVFPHYRQFNRKELKILHLFKI